MTEQTTSVIVREKVCPLLLRVFWRLGGHHRADAYDNAKRKYPVDELQIYTWPDATLGEISDLIRDVNSDARKKHAKLSISFVYPDKRGRNTLKEVGVVFPGRKKGEDDSKSLASLGFQTGDFLDVAIYV